MNRLLITGAAGGLGQAARSHLAGFAKTLRLSDLTPIDDLSPTEEFVPCDLADRLAVERLVQGCDGIVHLGGISTEHPFDVILEANIRGIYNLYEAVVKAGCPRVVFASSNHAFGYHRVTSQLDANSAPFADGLYGASKVYGEQLALIYHQKHGVESLRVRIGSCLPKPVTRRMLSTWISPRDLFSLMECAFTVPKLGCPAVFGASDNAASWWDNSAVDHLGWTPQDSVDGWQAEMEAAEPNPDPNLPEVRFQGGLFAADVIHRTLDD